MICQMRTVDAVTTANTAPIGDDGVPDHTGALPAALSPSRAGDYNTCPRLFYYKTILGLDSPPTAATLKGNLVHAVAETLFDRPEHDWTVQTAIAMIPDVWNAMRTPAPAAPQSSEADSVRAQRAQAAAQVAATVVPVGSRAEEQLLAGAQESLRNWFSIENVAAADPRNVTLPDGSVIDGREIHVQAVVGGVPVHGFIDRLNDYVAGTHRHWVITDYKTGRKPGPRYQQKAFFQLRLYAAAFSVTFGRSPDWLRLVYTTSTDRVNGILQVAVTDTVLQRAEQEIGDVWRRISASARTRTWPTSTGPLCAHCYFQQQCPAWAPQIASLPDGQVA